jgi:transcription-repair coupling factor (superfamily II helicase)
MLDFVARKFDVLRGDDDRRERPRHPNANTIIINRADRYGLSQLLSAPRPRRTVRIDLRHAYLLIPPEDNLSPVATNRLAAIKEFSDLGSGFRVAALASRSAAPATCSAGRAARSTRSASDVHEAPRATVRELKGEELEDDLRATVNLRVDLKIDAAYVPDVNQRLMLYRKVAAARDEDEIDRVLEEAADRYGPPPDSVLNLADYGRIRVMADRLGIDTVDREARTVVLKFRPQAKIDPVRLVALVRQRPELTLVPPAGLKLNLDGFGIRDSGPTRKASGPTNPKS